MPSEFREGRSPRSLRLLALRLAIVLLFVPSLARAGDALVADGAALYARHCASCHRPLAKTLLHDRTFSRIRSSIERLAVMYSLRSLSDDEVAAIVEVLSSDLPQR